VVGVAEADEVAEDGERVSLIGLEAVEVVAALEEALLEGDDGDGEAPLLFFVVDADQLDVQELELEVAVELVPAPAMILEASSGEIVRVVGGNVAVDPDARTIVTVTVPSPRVELLAVVDGSFEVVLDVSPPLAPVAPIRDRAFASLVHAMN
jgi:hypothetical protein